MSGLTVYDFEFDEGCYKVRLLLSMLGLEYEKIAVNMVPGSEHKQPAMLRLNPLGTLPVLVDARKGDTAVVLREAEAILAYLAYRDDTVRSWLPTAPGTFGAVMAWLTFSARDLAAAVLARLNAMFDEPADTPAVIAASRKAFRAMDDHMTARSFEGGLWFVGATPTLADLALFPSIALSRDIGIEHEAYPALRHWMRRVRALPGFLTMPGIPDYH